MQKVEGSLVWVTGLAGSGKTTLARRVFQAARKKGYSVVHLDGDKMRRILGENRVHDLSSRMRTAKVYSRFANYLTQQGIDVIVSTISLFHSIRDYNRANNRKYIEVFLDVGENVLMKRNKNGLYGGYIRGVVGVDQVPEYPKNPHLTIRNETLKDLSINVDKILGLMERDKK